MKPIVFLDIDDVVAIDPNFSGSTVVAALKNNRNIEEKFWASVFLSSAVSNLSLMHEDFSPSYVISSSWTNYLNRDQVAFAFNSAGLDFIAKKSSSGMENAENRIYWAPHRNSNLGLEIRCDDAANINH